MRPPCRAPRFSSPVRVPSRSAWSALCAGFAPAKALFDRASEVLGYDLLGVCAHGPADRLNATDVSQPAIFVASLAALEQLKATEPDALAGVVATAGLSLGEYTALVYAARDVRNRTDWGHASPVAAHVALAMYR